MRCSLRRSSCLSLTSVAVATRRYVRGRPCSFRRPRTASLIACATGWSWSYLQAVDGIARYPLLLFMPSNSVKRVTGYREVSCLPPARSLEAVNLSSTLLTTQLIGC